MNNEDRKKKLEEFMNLAKPLIKFINDNFNPRTQMILTSTNAEIVSGQMGFTTEEFLKD